MNTGLLLAFFLVLLGFGWGFWLIFKDKVTQPVGVIMYFLGAVLAVLVAIFITVRIFPGIAIRFLDMANTSSDVQTLQQRTDELFGSVGQPYATRPAPVVPTAPVSPIASPGGGASIQSAATPAPGQVVHVVQLGETMYSIARRYGVTPKSIQDINQLPNPDVIKPGQRLVIPKP